MLYNSANNMTLPIPDYMRHFQIFNKFDTFQKKFSNDLDSKKPNYIFDKPLTFSLALLLLHCRFQKKIEPS